MMQFKTILILLLLTLQYDVSTAQSNRFNVGAEVFPALTRNFGGLNYHDEEFKTTVSYGLLFNYKLTDRLVIESGLKYLVKGEKTKPRDDYFFYYFNDERDYRYTYLSVPLNMRLAFGETIDKGFYLRFGCSPTFFLSHDAESTFTDYYGNRQVQDITDEDDIRKTHLNFNFGLGYSFLVKDKYQISFEPAADVMFYKLFHKPNKGYDEVYHSFGLSCRFMVL